VRVSPGRLSEIDWPQGVHRSPQRIDIGMYWRSRILQLSECLSVASRDFGFDGLGGGSLAAAVGGGISGPVAAAGALPGDGDGDVSSEHSGEQGCGKFGGELEQCRRAGLAGAQSELSEAFAELVGDRGLSTLQAAKRLNALGLTPRNVPLWTSQNLRNCMRRGQWDGQWTFGKGQSKGSTFAPVTIPIDPVLDAARAAALKAHLERTKVIPRGTGVHPLSGRLICACGERMTGIIRSDRANRRYRCRRAHQVPGRPFCHEPSVLGDKVDDAVWAQVLDLLMDPDLLMALASERLDMLRGAARVTVDSLGDAEAAVMRTQRALASGAAKCLTLDLDEGTTVATLAELREQHRAAVQHRAMVAAMSEETAAAAARMVTAQQLAHVARERLQNADRALQARVFALLDVRVTILEHGDHVRVRVEGSVAHDLLLSSVSGGLAPSKLAPHGT
jgi:hypothetical protein